MPSMHQFSPFSLRPFTKIRDSASDHGMDQVWHDMKNFIIWQRTAICNREIPKNLYSTRYDKVMMKIFVKNVIKTNSYYKNVRN